MLLTGPGESIRYDNIFFGFYTNIKN